jgi:hypothetical protein
MMGHLCCRQHVLTIHEHQSAPLTKYENQMQSLFESCSTDSLCQQKRSDGCNWLVNLLRAYLILGRNGLDVPTHGGVSVLTFL